jgi:circadian clock protein KaiB
MSDDRLGPESKRKPDLYDLRLYVVGSSPKSSRAIANLKAICEAHLKDRYSLTVVDLYVHPERAKDDQIVVAPTLIRQFPLPTRRLIGDLSQTERVLTALELAPAAAKS